MCDFLVFQLFICNILFRSLVFSFLSQSTCTSVTPNVEAVVYV